MIFQIYKTNPSTKESFNIPFQNGNYDVKLIKIDTYYNNYVNNSSMYLLSDKLYNNSKEFINNQGAKTARNIAGLFLLGKNYPVENMPLNNASTYFNCAFHNVHNIDEVSWKNVYLDGYIDFQFLSGAFIFGDFAIGTTVRSLVNVLITLDITPVNNKLSINEYLNLNLISN